MSDAALRAAEHSAYYRACVENGITPQYALELTKAFVHASEMAQAYREAHASLEYQGESPRPTGPRKVD
jgi:hypothetical protein